MSVTVEDFIGKIKCAKCGHRFYKSVSVSVLFCPRCMDKKTGGVTFRK